MPSAIPPKVKRIRAATDENISGSKYYGRDGFGEFYGRPIKVDSNKISKDEMIAARLWKVSEEMTTVKFKFGCGT